MWIAPSREDAYAEWLAARLERGGARLESATLHAFQQVRIFRMNKAVKPGPQALMRGVLIVADSDLFASALVKGIGRHKAYGYGMLLLRPSYRSDIKAQIDTRVADSAAGLRLDNLRRMEQAMSEERASAARWQREVRSNDNSYGGRR